MKDKIVFDATVPADSDNIGAYLRASDGTLVTHTTVSAKQALDAFAMLADGAGTALTSTLVSGKQGLDVNIVSSIAVDLNGIYNVSTNPTPDNVGAIFFARNAAPGLAQQTFTGTGGVANADAVVAANVWGQDSNSFGMGFNGTTWDRLTATAGAQDINIKTQAGALTVSDAALANTAAANNATSIPTTAGGTAVVTAALASRKYILLQNLGNQPVYLGTGTVSAANGFRLSASSVLELRAGAAVTLKAIASAGSQDLRTLELS